MKKILSTFKLNCGFTITEVLVALTILCLILAAVMGTFYTALRGISSARARTVATNLANQQMETMRNMPYDEVGTTTGWPYGDIPATQWARFSNVVFTIKTSVNYIDDSYDGKAIPAEGEERDLYPYDYKRVKIKVSWSRIPCSNPVRIASDIAPKGPETASNTGTISIKVLDAEGEPVPDAQIHIENSTVIQPIDDATGNDGKLLVPSLPPDEGGYQVSAAKFGYSTDSTSPVTEENPYPEKPNLSVIATEVSEVTLAIDKLSTLTIDFSYEDSYGNSGSVGGAEVTLTGGKLLGTDPSIPKYLEELAADSNGHLRLDEMEWDSYTVALRGDTADKYEVLSASPEGWEIEELEEGGAKVVVISLEPDKVESGTIILRPRSLKVTVKDGGSGAALPGASVRVLNTEIGFDQTLSTGSDGTVLFTPLDQANYQVEVSKSGYGSQVFPEVEISGEETLDVSL